MRGGSFFLNDGAAASSAQRFAVPPSSANSDNGVRIVLGQGAGPELQALQELLPKTDDPHYPNPHKWKDLTDDFKKQVLNKSQGKFEDGLIHPETLIDDRAVRYGAYAPENFDDSFHGTVTVREALQQSLNVPAKPCSAMTWMLSSGCVLGRMACVLLWQASQYSPPWPVDWRNSLPGFSAYTEP